MVNTRKGTPRPRRAAQGRAAKGRQGGEEDSLAPPPLPPGQSLPPPPPSAPPPLLPSPPPSHPQPQRGDGGAPPRPPRPAQVVVLGVDPTVPAFLQSLFLMLSDDRTDPHIAWADAGDSFYINTPTEFAVRVLPRFFRHGNYETFVRQLSYYGFRKVGRDDNVHHYAHPQFQRDQPALLSAIKRRTFGAAASASKKRRIEGDGPDGMDSEVNRAQQLAEQVDRLGRECRQLRDGVGALQTQHNVVVAALRGLVHALSGLPQNEGVLGDLVRVLGMLQHATVVDVRTPPDHASGNQPHPDLQQELGESAGLFSPLGGEDEEDEEEEDEEDEEGEEGEEGEEEDGDEDDGNDGAGD